MTACAGAPGSLLAFHQDALRGLSAVKAELDASIKARALQAHPL